MDQTNETLQQYLSMFTGDGSGYLAISNTDKSHFRSLKTTFVPADNMQSVLAHLKQISATDQVVIGVGRIGTPPNSGRGTAKDVTAFRVIGMDIDIQDVAKTERNHPLTIDDALELLQGFSLPPTAVVKSGRGLHAYWMLDEDFVIDSEETLKIAKKFVKDFYGGFGEYAKPLEFDHTQDLARVFRVPGFTNQKDPVNPLSVEVVYIELEYSYTREQIESVSVTSTKGTVTQNLNTPQVTTSNFNSQLMASGCNWVKQAMEHAASAKYDEWFATASLLSHSNNGEKEFHDYSSGYPGYDAEETQAMFDQIDPEKAMRSCSSLVQISGFERACDGCVFRGGVHSPVELGIPGRRAVFTNGRQLETSSAELWTAVHVNNEPPTLFKFNDKLCRVTPSSGAIELLDQRSLSHTLARIATWLRTTRFGDSHANPSPAIINDAMNCQVPPVPVLRRVSRLPLITKDKEIISHPGYDKDSKVYILPGVARHVRVNKSATVDDARQAVSFLVDEMLVDFPFQNDASRANALAVMIQPLVRELFSGPSPLYLIDKPLAGSGATLLANALSFPMIGKALPIKTWPPTVDERRKQITAHLLSGSEVFMWDNISGSIDCDVFASVLTAAEYSDRILGSSTQVEMTNEGLWIASGNNPNFSMQLVRRIANIRLIPETDNPTARTGFKHNPLMDWVAENRSLILEALFTIVIAWINEGCPEFSGHPLASYESWSSVIGGILETCGVPGFLTETAMSRGVIDTETEMYREFVKEWYETFSGELVTASNVVDRINECELSEEWLSHLGKGRVTKCGQVLARLLDRYFTIEIDGTEVLVQVVNQSRKYRLRVTKPDHN